MKQSNNLRASLFLSQTIHEQYLLPNTPSQNKKNGVFGGKKQPCTAPPLNFTLGAV